MPGEGKMLREAREDKGWTLAMVEDATKIRIRYLEALENENYSIIPGVVYIKGFLRTYAKHLGLDPENVVALYKAAMTDEAAPALDTSIAPRKRPLWFRPVAVALMALLAFGTVLGIAFWSNPGATEPPVEYSPTPLPTPPETPEQPQPAVIPAPEPSGQTGTVTIPTEGLVITLTFTQDCWLVAKVDGKPALDGTFKAGTTQELLAKDKIELVTIGNAGGVVITLNGEVQPSLGASKQVVHNKVFTKDMLKTQ